MKRVLGLVALVSACGGSPAVPEQPPPRPEPAPDDPTPVPDPASPDASAPPEEVAKAERDGDPRGDPLSTDPDAAVVAGVFFGMHFPPPVGGYVTVRYPFVFAKT